ncbi:hypothetical protein [Candidatus Solirubrobacter pratensis]|uniref:hypothetical protein n=1 Tax=Candidatus Solirubrobacter pratensis TaxID=1298857 RepID=UPI0004285357|nr:hypothetical protein [Candidatus Solirubrobacter pratensis]
MRRTIFLALLATLLLMVPAARAADPTTVIKDCEDDSVLQGSYTLSELRQARSHLPSDIDEYSDCRDVLGRAIAAKTSTPSSNGDNNGGGSSSAGAGGGAGAGGTGGGTSGGAGSGAYTPPIRILPTTPQDHAALTQAAKQGDRPVSLDGKAVMPGGASRLAAEVGRNTLPTTLVLVLIMLALAAVLGGGLRIRNRVVTHRQP